MEHATVAIVVRTKDRPDFLRRALTSITSQTLKNWECVIVNDGGDPGPVQAAIGRLSSEHAERIKLINSPSSRGRWVSANAGVLATTAPLLTLHDDDDSWHPEFLARAVEYLRGRPDRGGVVSRIQIRWERPTPTGYEVVKTEEFQPHLPSPTLADTLQYNRFVPIAFVYRRSLHEELGLYDESLPVVGDWAFNLRVLARGPIDYLDEQTYAYWHQRVNVGGADGNSVISSSDEHSYYDARIRDDALREYVDANGLGLVLYLTNFIDKRFVEVEAGIRREIDLSFGALPLLRRFRRGVSARLSQRRSGRESRRG